MLRRLPAAAASATARNTLFADGLASPQRPNFRRLTPDQLRAEAESLQGDTTVDTTVLYLGAVPHLPAQATAKTAGPEVQAAHQTCSRGWLYMYGPEWDAFVNDTLPHIGGE